LLVLLATPSVVVVRGRRRVPRIVTDDGIGGGEAKRE